MQRFSQWPSNHPLYLLPQSYLVKKRCTKKIVRKNAITMSVEMDQTSVKMLVGMYVVVFKKGKIILRAQQSLLSFSWIHICHHVL